MSKCRKDSRKLKLQSEPIIIGPHDSLKSFDYAMYENELNAKREEAQKLAEEIDLLSKAGRYREALKVAEDTLIAVWFSNLPLSVNLISSYKIVASLSTLIADEPQNTAEEAVTYQAYAIERYIEACHLEQSNSLENYNFLKHAGDELLHQLSLWKNVTPPIREAMPHYLSVMRAYETAGEQAPSIDLKNSAEIAMIKARDFAIELLQHHDYNSTLNDATSQPLIKLHKIDHKPQNEDNQEAATWVDTKVATWLNFQCSNDGWKMSQPIETLLNKLNECFVTNDRTNYIGTVPNNSYEPDESWIDNESTGNVKPLGESDSDQC